MTAQQFPVDEVLRRLEVDAARAEVLREGLSDGILGVHGRLDAGLVVATELGEWRTIEGMAGSEGEVVGVLRELQECSGALHLVGTERPSLAVGLQELGFRSVARETFLQDLTRVPRAEEPPNGIGYALCDGDRITPAKRLFGATHAFSVEGIYCTRPRTPTAPLCQDEFSDYLYGGFGAVTPPASLVAMLSGRVVGVVVCSGVPDRQGVAQLLALAVDPSARGAGIARGLVRRAQAGLLASGYTHMEFHTTDRNLPVHRLFVPEEIVSTEVSQDWVWMRGR